MRDFIVSRVIWGFAIVLAILVLNFLIIHTVPGDPLQALLGDFPVPPGYAEKIRADFGLDQPVLTQLWLYLSNLAHGNLGFSFANRAPVLTLVLGRLGPTSLLMLPALIFAAIFGVMLGLDRRTQVVLPHEQEFRFRRVDQRAAFGAVLQPCAARVRRRHARVRAHNGRAHPAPRGAHQRCIPDRSDA